MLRKLLEITLEIVESEIMGLKIVEAAALVAVTAAIKVKEAVMVAGGSPEPQSNVEAKEISQFFITSGNPVKFDFSKNATSVVYVSFDSKKTVGRTTAIAEMLRGKSTLVSE